MNTTSPLIKVNGLCYVILGAIFIFFPQQISTFLSLNYPMTQLITLLLGIGFNLSAMYILWLGNKTSISRPWIRSIVILNGIWMTLSLIALLFTQWITSTNGITTVGMKIILLAWISGSIWILKQGK